MSEPVSDAVLAEMRVSERVSTRTEGVVATWLRANPYTENNELVAAKTLVRAMGEAGLVTLIETDLRDYLREAVTNLATTKNS